MYNSTVVLKSRRFFMSLSEFRFNKKRKHYAYLFKQIGLFRKNILFTSKPIRIWKGKTKKSKDQNQ